MPGSVQRQCDHIQEQHLGLDVLLVVLLPPDLHSLGVAELHESIFGVWVFSNVMPATISPCGVAQVCVPAIGAGLNSEEEGI